MSEPQKKTRRSRQSYVSQEQIALTDAASAIEKKLDISQLKLISRRLETLASLAADERAANKEKNDAALRDCHRPCSEESLRVGEANSPSGS